MKLATLCYLKKDGKTLMMHRVKKKNDVHEGKWNGLGGKFLPGETPEECVVREVREESGLRLKDPVLKGLLTFPLFDGKDDWYVFVFVGRRFRGRPSACSEGRLEWIADDRLPSLNLWEGDRVFLPWLERGGFFSGKFVYRRGRLASRSAAFYPPLSRERKK
jgi:8-oxo-dGTP diphosphatase